MKKIVLIVSFFFFILLSTQMGFSYSINAPVPEAASMLLLGTGLIGMGAFLRKKVKK